jgi:hypothetical protein
MDSFLYDSDDSALDGVSFKRIVSTAPIQVASQDIAIETNLSSESEESEHYSPLHTAKDNCDVDEYEKAPFGGM